jgi:hypothetical protein
MADTTVAITPTTTNRDQIITTPAVVKSSETLLQGQLVAFDASGLATNATSILKIAGIAKQTVEAGKIIQCEWNHVVRLALSGASAASLGEMAFAADNQTATLTPGTDNQLGRVTDWETDYVYVKLNMPPIYTAP